MLKREERETNPGFLISLQQLLRLGFQPGVGMAGEAKNDTEYKEQLRLNLRVSATEADSGDGDFFDPIQDP